MVGVCIPELWHKKLSHVLMAVLVKMPGFNNSSDFHLQHYDVCPMSRQTRLPFPISNTRAVEVFQLIHLDVWGPYHAETQNGMKYFFIMVDDYSR